MAALGVTPSADVAAKYAFAIVAVDGPPPTFTISATATGEQARDKCPVLTIDGAGNRTPAECW
jgi:type IV pilus assembly protein PilE